MIGKQEWFKRRKYGGWGLFPATWQGWVYTLVIIAPIIATQYVPINDDVKVVFMVVWALIFSADLIHIMVTMNKDEREKIHEAIAERNALWTIIFVLVAGIAYQTAQSSIIGEKIVIDPVIIIALFAALIAKAITNFYLDRNN